MPSARFKLVVGVMSALTVAVYVGQPVLVGAAPAPRKAAEDFTLPTVDGSTFSLAAQPNGTFVVLDFMATWCFPCRQELKDLRDIRFEFSPDVLTIVSIDEEYGLDGGAVMNFRQAFGQVNSSAEGAEWYFAVDTVEQHVGIRYGVTALPTVVLIDGEGNVAKTWFGAVSSATLASAVRAELAA